MQVKRVALVSVLPILAAVSAWYAAHRTFEPRRTHHSAEIRRETASETPAPAMPPTPAQAILGAKTAPGATYSWQEQIEARIRTGEYALHAEGETLGGSNPKQGFATAWRASGVEVARIHSTTETAPVAPGPLGARAALPGPAEPPAKAEHQLVVHTESDEPFVPGACRQDGAVDEMGNCLRRAERTVPGGVEWWENTPEGLEQGFDLARAPERASAEEPLRIPVSFEGASVVLDADSRGATLKMPDKPDFRYDRLAARDADGRSLPARMIAESSAIVLEVDDRGARYPIVVDPILTTASWTTKELNQAGARLGISVASAGDVDRDGYGDVLVGADMYDNGTSADEGRAYLYRGSATGLSTTAAWNAGSGHANSRYGVSVAGAGDVNGDGYGDFIVGAFWDTNGQNNEGRAYVYYGSSSLPTAGPILEQNQATAGFGFSVACAGDVNGDGYSDVIVGAQGFDAPNTDSGAAFLFHGGSGGLSTSFARRLDGVQASAYFGIAVSAAGDVNGDGYGDVLVGAYMFDGSLADEGRTTLYYGSASGVAASAGWTRTGGQAGALYGGAVSAIGDMNADGYGDFLVGAYGYDGGLGKYVDSGKVFLYLGSSAGPPASGDSYSRELNQASAYLGLALSGAGDVNGDGYADMLFGAPGWDTSSVTDAGRAEILFGGASNPAFSIGWVVTGSVTNEYVGWSVGSAGDVNGDGYGDVIVGAPGYSNGHTGEGLARVYHGGAEGLADSPGTPLASTQAGARFGHSVVSAGDVNGDGYDDVIVGAPYAAKAFGYYGGPRGPSTTASWSASGISGGTYFGYMVASAGDVNADGYADVLVGQRFSASIIDKIYLYLGGSGGLASAPVWSNPAGSNGCILGTAAGDVDGDGYGDIVAECSYSGFPIGYATAVFYGAGTASPIRTGVSVVSGLHGGRAGDVNGDGYEDVVTGDEVDGTLEVHNGGAFGVSPTANGQITGTGTNFGQWVGAAGDVNADGYADVFGASVDRCYVYLGGSAGVSTGPNWNKATGQGPSATCASAGDVNGDGFGDMVVGDGKYDGSGTTPPASTHGTVTVYTGGPGGVSNSPLWSYATSTGGDSFGTQVSAGDLNGDGYSDVIVGAPSDSTGGHTYLFYGNSLQAGTGASLRLQAVRTTSSTTAIAPGARTFNTSFLAGFTVARGTAGRTTVRMQTEDKSFGTAFNGLAATYSGYFNTTLTGTTMRTSVTKGFSGLIPHYRVRLEYKPGSNLPWFQRTRWVYGGRLGESRSAHARQQ